MLHFLIGSPILNRRNVREHRDAEYSAATGLSAA